MTVIAVAAGVLLLIGFICGYALRELISRLRRAKARQQHFEHQREEITRTRRSLPSQRNAWQLATKAAIAGMSLLRGECHDCCCSGADRIYLWLRCSRVDLAPPACGLPETKS